MKNFLSIFSLTFLNIISLITSYMAFKSWKTALICTMIVAFFSLLSVIIYTTYKNKKQIIKKDNIIRAKDKEIESLKNKLLEEKNNNNNLTTQYNKKRKKCDWVERYWVSLNNVFQNAIQGSPKERFKDAYQLYLTYSEYINKYEED